MKKILSTIALSILLFSCKQENKNIKIEETKKPEAEKIVYKEIIKDKKIEEFSVSLFQGKDEFEGKIELKKDGIEKPFTYTFKDIPYFSQHIEHVLAFEDFNFDGEKEIVISGDNGIYIYDRKTGKEKKFFEKEKAGGYAKTGSQNYIFTYRGEYIKDEKEKTITITGACGAGCGVEEIYRVESPETMKLVKKCEWDY
ncbi:hypothetical protein LIS90_12705 [Flavobacterium psychrophilum]|uniref:Lipoprotein n=1 Tax=Flavobacterium psychrophilum TaxID=96345 RepID=A0A7U2NGZ2_FLAPS|nr:hypothetical protein [Flavobacterium psychrophilum]ELI6456058.1 hypothetical protein [Flavobacterium psychrophilum]MCB6232104.1 hypothetical protein [Flavobacterium psychrophilum]MEB3380503.1 hypothetical protein [Flavobacterium psychrophilum]OJH14063.1 hypothetical protein FPG87_12580 [Flavobacterium psychrophilum]OUD24853.1 hypothetical protein FPG92_12495 [Flavobacterium psychrophilum]